MSGEKNSPSARESVTGSTVRANEVCDSVLEELQNLINSLEPILHTQEASDTAMEGTPPNPVRVIEDVDRIYRGLLEIRHIIRDTSDRLAL